MTRVTVEILLVFLGGLLLGGGAVFGLKHETKSTGNEDVAKGQIEVQKNLTNFDIVMPICSPEYIKEHNSDLLCRELTCLMFTRGLDSQTNGATCEEISNVLNKRAIIDYCNTFESEEHQSNCINLFWRRN